MNIFYIHGFNSGGNSSTTKLLKDAFPDAFIQSYSFDINDPIKTYTQLANALSVFNLDKNETVIVGTSLGGFWAEFVCRNFGYRAVAVNPARKPFENLSKYLGKNKNFVTGLEYEFTKEQLDSYRDVNLELNPVAWPLIALLYEGDEVVDTKARYAEMKSFCDARLIPGGQHRLTEKEMPDLVKAVNDVLNCVVS